MRRATRAHEEAGSREPRDMAHFTGLPVSRLGHLRVNVPPADTSLLIKCGPLRVFLPSQQAVEPANTQKLY